MGGEALDGRRRKREKVQTREIRGRGLGARRKMKSKMRRR